MIGEWVGPQAGFTRLAVRRNGGRRSGIPTRWPAPSRRMDIYIICNFLVRRVLVTADPPPWDLPSGRTLFCKLLYGTVVRGEVFLQVAAHLARSSRLDHAQEVFFADFAENGLSGGVLEIFYAYRLGSEAQR